MKFLFLFALHKEKLLIIVRLLRFYFLGNNVLLGYNNSKFNTLTNINKDITVPMETLALSVNLDSDNFDLLSFTTGLLKEENTFLLSEGSGAFDLNNKDNLSNFYGFNFSKSLNNLGNIYVSTMFGNSKLNNTQNSFIVDTSDVLSSNFEINYELKNLFKNDQFNKINTLLSCKICIISKYKIILHKKKSWYAQR